MESVRANIMIDSIVNILVQGISSVISWFEAIFSSTGFGTFFLGFALIFSAYRFILQPIFGRGVGSDKAKKSDSKES